VVPSAAAPQAAGIAATDSSIRVVIWVILPSRKAICSSSNLGELAVVVIEDPVQRRGEVVPLGLHRAAGQPGQHLRVAFPAIIALIISCAETVVSLLATNDTLTSALQQLSRPLPAPGPLLHQPGPGPGAVA